MARSVDEVFAEIASWESPADELEKRGIKGTPECTDKCPMAVFILAETSRDEVWSISVDNEVTRIYDDAGNKRVIDNPVNMCQFISRFDQGDYRSLCSDPSCFSYFDEEDEDEDYDSDVSEYIR